VPTRRRYHTPFFDRTHREVRGLRTQARREHADAEIVSLRRREGGKWDGCLSTAAPLDRFTRGLFVREGPARPRPRCLCRWRR
jgi:hypothetical protein